MAKASTHDKLKPNESCLMMRSRKTFLEIPSCENVQFSISRLGQGKAFCIVLTEGYLEHLV